MLGTDYTLRTGHLLFLLLVGSSVILGLSFLNEMYQRIQLQTDMAIMQRQTQHAISEKSAIEHKAVHLQVKLEALSNEMKRLQDVYEFKAQHQSEDFEKEKNRLLDNISIKNEAIHDLREQYESLKMHFDNVQSVMGEFERNQSRLLEKFTAQSTQCMNVISMMTALCDKGKDKFQKILPFVKENNALANSSIRKPENNDFLTRDTPKKAWKPAIVQYPMQNVGPNSVSLSGKTYFCYPGPDSILQEQKERAASHIHLDLAHGPYDTLLAASGIPQLLTTPIKPKNSHPSRILYSSLLLRQLIRFPSLMSMCLVNMIGGKQHLTDWKPKVNYLNVEQDTAGKFENIQSRKSPPAIRKQGFYQNNTEQENVTIPEEDPISSPQDVGNHTVVNDTDENKTYQSKKNNQTLTNGNSKQIRLPYPNPPAIKGKASSFSNTTLIEDTIDVIEEKLNNTPLEAENSEALAEKKDLDEINKEEPLTKNKQNVSGLHHDVHNAKNEIVENTEEIQEVEDFLAEF
ncbi:uncharacterized protein PAF06_009722 [Gastrophryne carolinensis]